MAVQVVRKVSGREAAEEFKAISGYDRYGLKNKIRDLRERNGWTSQEFAGIIGMSPSGFNWVERTRLSSRETITFRKILAGFGVTGRDANEIVARVYPEMHTTELGSLIRSARESSFLTRVEFGMQIELSSAVIGDIEKRGSRSNHANEENLRKIVESESGVKFSQKEKERILSLQSITRKSTEELETESAKLKKRLDEIAKELARR